MQARQAAARKQASLEATDAAGCLAGGMQQTLPAEAGLGASQESRRLVSLARGLADETS